MPNFRPGPWTPKATAKIRTTSRITASTLSCDRGNASRRHRRMAPPSTFIGGSLTRSIANSRQPDEAAAEVGEWPLLAENGHSRTSGFDPKPTFKRDLHRRRVWQEMKSRSKEKN